MKVRDLYAMICVIFATNFKGIISKDNFKKFLLSGFYKMKQYPIKQLMKFGKKL